MTNPRTGYPDGYLIYLVKQIELGLRRPFEEILTLHDLSMAGYTALTVLQNLPGLTSSELARRSFVRAQTMAQTIEPLLEAGYVRREQDPQHGRQILLYITDAGLACVASISPEMTHLESRIVDGLTDDESAALVTALRKCRDALARLTE